MKNVRFVLESCTFRFRDYTSNYINFNAVATFVAAFLILGEHVSAVALVGSAAVIFGVWLAEGK